MNIFKRIIKIIHDVKDLVHYINGGQPLYEISTSCVKIKKI